MDNKPVLTIAMITAEALRTIEENLAFTQAVRAADTEALEGLRKLVNAEAEYWRAVRCGERSLLSYRQ